MDILFENDDYISVNKPENVSSLSGKDDEGLPGLVKAVRPGKLFPVHRLDKDASGVIVFARNPEAHRHLNREFDSRAVRKSYLLVVHGLIKQARGTIDKPIREFGSGRMGIDRERGKESRTDFEVLEKFRNFTLVEAHPRTGRRHQLRVHFYSIGHPVVGDRRYGDKAAQEAFPRLMLHARTISFGLPSGGTADIEAPPPTSFTALLDELRRGR